MKKIKLFLFLFTLSLSVFSKDVENFNKLDQKVFDVQNSIKSGYEKNKEIITKIKELSDLVKESGAYIKSFKDLYNGIIATPIGLTSGKKKSGKEDYAIIIEKFEASDEKPVTFNLYMAYSFKSGSADNQKEKFIAFKLEDAPISGKGGFGKGGTLKLVSPIDIEIAKGVMLIFKEGTTVKFGCDGFESVHAVIDIIFPPSFKVVDAQGKKLDRLLKTSIVANFSSFDEFSLSTVLTDSFIYDSFDDVIFTFRKIIIDNDESKTSSLIKFPEGYTDNLDGWTGLYISEGKVTMSKRLSKNQDLAIGVKGLIVDRNGVTGEFKGENLSSKSLIKKDKWDINVENIKFKLYKSQLEFLELNGHLGLPPFASVVTYGASFDRATGEFVFSSTLPKTFNLDIYVGELNILASSRIVIKFRNGSVYPSLYLNGDLSINATNFKVPGITFQDMLFSSQAPYFNPGIFSLTGDSPFSFSGFPISFNGISSFGFKMPKVDLSLPDVSLPDVSLPDVSLPDISLPAVSGLKFDININISDKFSGSTGISLNCDFSKWEFLSLDINKVSLDIDMQPSFTMKGTVEYIKGDAIYGNGFRGRLKMLIANMFDVDALVIFGKINRTRYFFTDANVFGLKIPAPPIIFTSFGGGLYYHMARATKPVKSSFGKSLSGVTYVPDKTVNLGLMARTRFCLNSPKTMQAQVGLEMQFNSHWGLNFIRFDGEAQFMVPEVQASLEDANKDLEKLNLPKNPDSKPVQSAPVVAKVNMILDFEHDIYSSNFDISLVFDPIVKGIGWAELYFSKETWHIYIGTPKKKNYINFVNFAQLEGYFMMGDDIPDMAPPPSEVLDVLGITDVNSRDDAILKSGSGLAFGAGMRMGGDFEFLAFYASFKFGIGFDMMLKNYGMEAYCRGREGTIGFDGWYASGQAWAYVSGDIGLDVDLGFFSKKVVILSIGGGALLQVKGPNPFWMRGNIGGSYSALGGLVSGKLAFDFELGEKCKLIKTNPYGIDIIAQLTPGDGEDEVNVFNTPQAVFNLPINKEFKIIEENDKNETVTNIYKIKLDHFTVKEKKTGKVLIGKQVWNKEMKVLTIDLFDPMPSTTEITASATIIFQIFRGGRWKDARVENKIAKETKEITFKSGVRPTTIDKKFIEYSYPIDRQYNFYKDEYGKGYIKLSKNFAYLFNKNSLDGFIQKIRFSTRGQNNLDIDFNYKRGDNIIQFNIPSTFKNNKVYKLTLINKPIQVNKKLDANIKQETANVDMNKESKGNSLAIKTQQAEGSMEVLEEKEILDMAFRTSKYNKFVDKIKVINYSNYLALQAYSPFLSFVSNTSNKKGKELFDKFENNLIYKEKSNLYCKALWNEYSWYTNEIKQLVYDKTVYEKINLTYTPPPQNKEMLYFTQWGEMKQLKDKEVRLRTKSYGAINFHLEYFINKDLQKLQKNISKILNYTSYDKITKLKFQKILNSHLPTVSEGDFPMKVEYYLPGATLPNSSKIINVKYINY